MSNSSIIFDEEFVLLQLGLKGLNLPIQPVGETFIDVMSVYQTNRGVLNPIDSVNQISKIVDYQINFLNMTKNFQSEINDIFSSQRFFKIRSFEMLEIFSYPSTTILSNLMESETKRNSILRVLQKHYENEALERINALRLAQNQEVIPSILEPLTLGFFEQFLFEVFLYFSKLILVFFEVFISFCPLLSLGFTFLRIINFLRKKIL